MMGLSECKTVACGGKKYDLALRKQNSRDTILNKQAVEINHIITGYPEHYYIVNTKRYLIYNSIFFQA